jgi:C4-dicarboxylate-specific signal transduction histidine kinase
MWIRDLILGYDSRSKLREGVEALPQRPLRRSISE